MTWNEDSSIRLLLLRLHLVIFCINSWNTHRCRGTRNTVSVFSVWLDFVFSTLQRINKHRHKTPPQQSRSRFYCPQTSHTYTLINTRHVNTHTRACGRASHVGFPELPTAQESTAWGPKSIFILLFPASSLHDQDFLFSPLAFHDRKITNHNPSATDHMT